MSSRRADFLRTFLPAPPAADSLIHSIKSKPGSTHFFASVVIACDLFYNFICFAAGFQSSALSLWPLAQTVCTPCHLVTKPHAATPQPPGLSLLFREKHSVQWCRTVQGDVTVAASFAPVLSFARWPRAQPHCRLGNRMQKRRNTGRLTEETLSDLATQARTRKYRNKEKMYKCTQPNTANGK